MEPEQQLAERAACLDGLDRVSIARAPAVRLYATAAREHARPGRGSAAAARVLQQAAAERVRGQDSRPG